MRASRVFTSRTIYGVSSNAGGGRSLPFALLARRSNWYGGLALVLQQVDASRPPHQGPSGIFVTTPRLPPPPGGAAIPGPDLRTHGNEYAFGMVGRSWQGSNLSVGASALWTGLHALDGVDLLYSGSLRVKQTGHAIDVRMGALKEWAGERGARSLEAIVVHNRFAATHNVVYVGPFWDPGLPQCIGQ